MADTALRAAMCAALCLVGAALHGPRTVVGEPAPAAPAIVVKGGHVLRGSVARRVAIEGRPFSVIATDFGEVLVPQSEIVRKVVEPAPADTFHAREVRIVRLEGSVQRRPAGETAWISIGAAEPAYAAAPQQRILPGDTVRTGADGTLELMLHRDAWIRVQPSSEIVIAQSPEPSSLRVLRGATTNDVAGRPRGATFRVATPSGVLGVRGTRFVVRVEEQSTYAAVLHGAVTMGTQLLTAGQMGAWRVGSAEPGAASPIEPADRGLLEQAGRRLPTPPMALVPGGRYVLGAGNSLPTNPDESARRRPLRGPTTFSSYFHVVVVDIPSFLIDLDECSAGDLAQWRGERLPPEAARRPALDVSSSQAQEYLAWTGKVLPTSVQWEIAARGTDTRSFPWGSGTGGAAGRSTDWGSWTYEAGWIPPTPLRDLDAPTLDTSPWGVRGLISGPPEWTRPAEADDRFVAGLTATRHGQSVSRTQPLVRGQYFSLLWIQAGGGSRTGFRGVREFPVPAAPR